MTQLLRQSMLPVHWLLERVPQRLPLIHQPHWMEKQAITSPLLLPAFDDVDSASYAGITDSTTLNFTTADVGDPTLSSSSPADGATGVAVDANIVLTFSEAVDVESGNIVIKKVIR